MADTNTKSPPIERFAQLVEHLESGNKPKADWRIGTEHEKFAVLPRLEHARSL